LLSSLEGVAITAIRIKGVEHEFSTLAGVKEDVVDIILNLKQARFEVSGEFEEPIRLELKVKGPKEIKAGNFKKVAGVKIANPDLFLATLTDAKTEFELEIWIERGRGYLPTEMMPTKERESGVIAIDSFFSPVRRVSIDTENVRVGEMTNWDRLILNLETDGTLSPEGALKKAAQILVEQFNFFITHPKTQKEEKTRKGEETEELRKADESEDKVEKEAKPKKRGRPKKNE